MSLGGQLQASCSTDKYVTQVIVDHFGVRPEDVGMLGADLDVVVYVRGDRSSIRITDADWQNLVGFYLPNGCRAWLFFIPADAAPELGEEAAARVYAAATGRGFTSNAERAAFVLGGAQAVVDLILGEQRERQPAERVLPA